MRRAAEESAELDQGGLSPGKKTHDRVMQLNIDVCLQMTVGSKCSNFTSTDLRVKPKTALNRAEVDESNEYSSKLERMNRNDFKLASKITSFEAYWLFGGFLSVSRS